MPSNKSKKKATLKASVQRGFTTTSVPKKVVPSAEPEPEPSTETAADSVSSTSAQPNGLTTNGAPAPTTPVEEWDETKMEEFTLQTQAERLRPVAEKEMARLIKTIEYERRLSLKFPSYTFPDRELMEEVLTALRQEEDERPLTFYEDDDKLLTKLLVLWGILLHLGFAVERIEECLRNVPVLDLDEVVDWLVLHLPEEDLTFERPAEGPPARYKLNGVPAQLPLHLNPPSAPKPVASLASSTSPLKPAPTSGASTPLTSSTPPSRATTDSNLDYTLREKILAAALASSAEDDTSLDDDPVGHWVRAKLAMTALGKPKTLATREAIRGWQGKMKEASQQYYFDIQRAEQEYEAALAVQNAGQVVEALTERLTLNKKRTKKGLNGATKGTPTTSSSTLSTPTPAEPVTPAPVMEDPVASRKAVEKTEESEGEEGGMFGTLLDVMPTTEEVAPSVTVSVRDMPLPKTWTSKPPRGLLEEVVRRIDKFSRVTFRTLSASRAVRAAVMIRFEDGRLDEYQATEACYDLKQAENYVATLALFHVAPASTSVQRQLPPVFRDLWDDLAAERKEAEDATYREHLQRIKAIAEPRLAQSSALSKPVRSTKAKTMLPTVDATSNLTYESPAPSVEIACDFMSRQAWPSYLEMLAYRNTLPIAAYRVEITQAIDANQVVILCGETGCGKSTQLPSFILEHKLAQGLHAKILCTEPRRISAISLAQRVSRELGEPAGACGSRSSLVGYTIRLESRTSASTRLTYATTGVVLRMLEEDVTLNGITHLIIDEVHERTIESDFLMIALKTILERRPDLRVILMSATVDAERLSAYWDYCPVLNVPGRTFPVSAYFLEDAIEICKYRLTESSDSPYVSRYRRTQPKTIKKDDDLPPDDDDDEAAGKSAEGLIQYSEDTKKTFDLLDESVINYDLIILILETACFKDPNLYAFSAATLVFLPSLEAIRRLSDMLESHPSFNDGSFSLHPLHSTIPTEQQSRVFEAPPRGVRKIVLATNIAETGITIPDITMVIDTGKHREMRFDEKRQISRLLEMYIARSNATQRRGRAGRVQEGIAFHLFSKHRHDVQFAEQPLPEMLRLSLQDLALRIKILRFGEGTIESVLSRALDAPSATNVQRAVASLIEVKALTVSEDITPLGRHLARLPVDVYLGKLLILGCHFACLDALLAITAMLNTKSPFVTPFGRDNEAGTIKRAFNTQHSDFLCMYKVYNAWKEACKAGSHQAFCRKNFLSHVNLSQAEELKASLYNALLDADLLSAHAAKGNLAHSFQTTKSRVRLLQTDPSLNTNSSDSKVIMGCLASAMYPKLVSISPEGEMRTLSNNAPAAIHPSSANFLPSRRPDFPTNTFLVFFNAMTTKRLYIWESGLVPTQAVYILCGDGDFKIAAATLSIDRRIRCRIGPKSALVIKCLRHKFVLGLMSHLRNRGAPEDLRKSWAARVLRCFATPESEKEQQTIEGPKTSISIVKAV